MITADAIHYNRAALEGFGILYILKDLVATPMAVSPAC